MGEQLFEDVREEAWAGLIPAEFSMDSSEVTSLQRPLPLYILLPRMGFLPRFADEVSHHFGEVAPDAQRTLWLEDASSGEPLRWHIPTGVLFDLLAGVPEANGGREVDPDDLRGDRDDGDAGPRSGLPWRITVHFQGCPRRQVFPLENEADFRRHYTNALKQALYLQLGSSRAGMTLAKDNQTRLWQALKTNDAKVFHEMDAFLDGGGGLRLVPVRLLTGSAPPSQLPIPTERPGGKSFTLRDYLCWSCPDVPWESASPPRSTPDTLETRASASSTGHDDQESRDDGGGSGEGEVVGGIGARADLNAEAGDGGAFGFGGDVGQACLPTVVVQGIEVPLDAPIAQLWGALRHPDHFLYVVVRKRRR